MQVQLRDGSNDFVKLQNTSQPWSPTLRPRAGCSASAPLSAPPRFYRIDVDRVKAETLHVSVDLRVFAALSSYMGSSYVTQFNKFGRTFQIYAIRTRDSA